MSAREMHSQALGQCWHFRQWSGDAVALGGIQQLLPGCGMDSQLRQPVECCQEVMPHGWGRVEPASLPDAQTGSCCTSRCEYALPGELAIYVAVCPYLCVHLPRLGRQKRACVRSI